MEKAIFDLTLYPEKPGVYLMKNAEGLVLYVGKAKNLRNRLRQYFSFTDTRVMIPHLLSKTQSIETILCFSEKEALLLENTLIKKHKPKYNVLLKDDKSYICLFMDPKSEWPKLELIRTKDSGRKKGLYFGPYSQTYAARQAYKVLSEYFGLRQCSDYEMKNRKRPCLLYGMKKCLAPCMGYAEKKAYKEACDEVIEFLEGHGKKLLLQFKEKIQEASDSLEYEKAGALYKTLKMLEQITYSRQMMVKVQSGDADIFNLYLQGSRGVVVKLLYREGKVVGQDAMHFEDSINEGSDLLSQILLQHYATTSPAEQIITPIVLDESSALSEILSENLSYKVKISSYQKGDKKALLDLAFENAKLQFEQKQDDVELLLELEEKAHLSRFPDVIECFDLSNLAGSDPVACKIRFEGGKLSKAGKRLFKIKEAKGGDDYGGMKETLLRSLKHSKEDNTLPDLILIDGGKGQVNIALEALKELDIACCDVIGLVKEGARHDKGLRIEKIVHPGFTDPIVLDKRSNVLFFLQNIRDKTHDAAIGFNQKRQKTRIIKSQLDEIVGIGPIKKKNLLKHFSSIQKIKEASLESLQEAPGINKSDAKKIYDFFHNSNS
jgi:excinuclease ABC subunit C